MKLKLIKKTVEAKGTKSFYWKPESKVKFLPGQYYYFTLPRLNFPDPRGETRHFTISNSPTESGLLRLTTRIREESGFKKTLDKLPIGSIIEGDGPEGTFILDENNTGTHVFLAGGIGITPYRSFIKYNLDKNLKISMYLIYSNSSNEFVFGKELSKWLKVEYLDTSKSGHLDNLKIKKFIENWKLKIENCTFWVVGPPPFVDAMETALEKLKVTSGRIQTEKFTGY